MTIYQENLSTVWPRLLELIKEDEYLADDLAPLIEAFLDNIAMQDGFGTEQQTDPRGDFRNGEWSLLSEVEV